MKTISVRDLKAHWAEVEHQIQAGETFEVLNRGKPTAHLIPARPRKILRWEDHLATALRVKGKSGAETVAWDREGRG
jgi:antitoxin (DNA-binding transcriptional repressor) of toxin-antitoxin stability system